MKLDSHARSLTQILTPHALGKKRGAKVVAYLDAATLPGERLTGYIHGAMALPPARHPVREQRRE